MDEERFRVFRPDIEPPYPDRFERITDFEYVTRLVLAREPEAPDLSADREATYVVAEPYTVRFKIDGAPRTLTVPEGMLTDLASVPRLARWFVGRVGAHLEAAIVHDFLFIAWRLLEGRGARRTDFDFANEVMFAGLTAAEVPMNEALAIRAALKFPFISWSVYSGNQPNAFFIRLDERFAATETGLRSV